MSWTNSPTPYLQDLISMGLEVGALESGDFKLEWAGARQLYDMHVAAIQLILNQQPKQDLSTIHQMVNALYPLAPGWAPVYHAPPAPGYYLFARAWAPYDHAQAHFKPRRGSVQAGWRTTTPQGLKELTIQPGDRWAYFPHDRRVEQPEDILKYL
jgi:hypothetical protein